MRNRSLEFSLEWFPRLHPRWTQDHSSTKVCSLTTLVMRCLANPVSLSSGKPFPTLSPTFIDSALPLLSYLLSLPSSLGPKSFADASKTYTDLRSQWIEEGLKNCAKEVLVDAVPSLAGSISSGGGGQRGGGGIEGMKERRGLGRLLDVMFAVLKVSRLPSLFLPIENSCDHFP